MRLGQGVQRPRAVRPSGLRPERLGGSAVQFAPYDLRRGDEAQQRDSDLGLLCVRLPLGQRGQYFGAGVQAGTQ